MTPAEFKKEHKRLIHVLRKGSKKEQEKEAQTQTKELRAQSGVVQSVILSRDHFKTLDQAKAWLMEHNYKYTSPDVTPHYYRFRQRDPKALEHTHRFRSIELKDIGYLIMAYPK